MERSKIILMEKRLYEASVKGDVSSLNQLMQEDALALARASATCFDETPLHIAAMLGHTDFAGALLNHRPGLASEQDSRGLSALHLAAANGYVHMVELLLFVDSDMCLAKDEDGRTALDMAVMKGRARVVEELVRARPEMARCTLDRGETLLHLATKHNRLETIKALVELGRTYGAAEPENEQDRDGNTVLHFAASLKQTETVKYLLHKTGIQVNAENRNGLTALGILENMPRDLKTMEIREALVDAGAFYSKKDKTRAPKQAASATEIHQAVTNPQRAEKKQEKSKCDTNRELRNNWMQGRADALLVASSVIAAMAYQAALQPPGGVSDGGPGPGKGKAGKSLLATHDPGAYMVFWATNMVSFIFSMSTMFLIISGLSLKSRALVSILMAAMWLTLTSMTFNYALVMYTITPGSMRGILDRSVSSNSTGPAGKPSNSTGPAGKPSNSTGPAGKSSNSTGPADDYGSYGSKFPAGLVMRGWLILVCIVLLVKLTRAIIWVIRKLCKKRKKPFLRQRLHQGQHSV